MKNVTPEENYKKLKKPTTCSLELYKSLWTREDQRKIQTLKNLKKSTQKAYKRSVYKGSQKLQILLTHRTNSSHLQGYF
jgi:hypothetical protein